MSEVRAKDLLREVINELTNLYDDGEALAIATRYLHDRFHSDRMKIALNTPIRIDQRLLKHDLELLKISTPLQHVVGFTEFYGHRFKCNPHALIPRPETEELVDWILKSQKAESGRQKSTILDIGTGTGCIPISIKKELPGIDVFGYDVSEDALNLAKQNAETLEAKVIFQQHDILAEALPSDSFDVIVSNPPYIPWHEKDQMHTNVVAHDPELALFVPDNDPLLFYRVIAEKSQLALRKGGLLFFEIHEGFGNEVKKLLGGFGYGKVELKQDINGKDRMIKASKK